MKMNDNNWYHSDFLSSLSSLDRAILTCFPSLQELIFLLFVMLWMALLAIWPPSIPAHLCRISSLLVTRDLPCVALGTKPTTYAKGIDLIIIWAGGVIKDFPLYFICSKRVTFSSREYFDNIPWIWSCCKALYCSDTRRFSNAVEASLLINLLSVLIALNGALRISLHCSWIFKIFSFVRIDVMYCEFTTKPKSSKINSGFNTDVK